MKEGVTRHLGMVSVMPGDPRECREYAVRCAELAAEAKTAELKLHFLSLSRTWEQIAREMERAQLLLQERSNDKERER